MAAEQWITGNFKVENPSVFGNFWNRTEIMFQESDLTYAPRKGCKRWVSYFDILGFGKKCNNSPAMEVFAQLAKCRKALEQRFKKQRKADWSKFEFVHFSDSFVIYNQSDNSEQDRPTFGGIEQVSHFFVQELILGGIPVRGAMSWGDFYADKERNIFFGKALVEAHDVAECCNWLGFVICPSAARRIETELGKPIEKFSGYADYYRQWEIPAQESRKIVVQPKIGTACRFDITVRNAARKQLFELLEKLRVQAEKPEQKRKYENTVAFLQNSPTA